MTTPPPPPPRPEEGGQPDQPPLDQPPLDQPPLDQPPLDQPSEDAPHHDVEQAPPVGHPQPEHTQPEHTQEVPAADQTQQRPYQAQPPYGGQQGYPEQPGYPGQSEQGYPSQSQQGYPSQGQPGYPGQGQPQQPYGAQPPTAYGSASARPLSSSEERTWAIFAHLSAPIAFLLSAGSLNFLGPLIIWAIFKDRSSLVRTASAGSFNFNVSIWIINALAGLLAVVTLGFGLLLAIPVWITTFVVAAIMHIMAAVKASNGEAYTYPLQIPILK
jgi:uncharacterized Tic20 family protein